MNKTERSEPQQPAVGAQVVRGVRRHAREWRDAEGCQEHVQQKGRTVRVIRGKGYQRPGSVACELKDTGNGFIARFPAHSSADQDKYVCLDYADARELVLALTPHARDLGFAA